VFSSFVSHCSSVFFRIMRLIAFETRLTAVLHPGSLVSCHSFVILFSYFNSRSRPGRSLLKSVACRFIGMLAVEVEVEVNLRPTVSRPVRLGIGPPYGNLDQILSCSFFSADNYLIILPKASSLTRRQVCSLQWNHSLVPITILYRFI
jgi:hypothetical protein